MNTKRYLIIVNTIVALLLIASVSYAQNGQGNCGGNGNNTGTCDPQNDGTGNQHNHHGQMEGSHNNQNQNGNSNMYGHHGTDNGMNGNTDFSYLPPKTEGVVPQVVIDAMTAGLMDEYNAYAAYDAIIAQFGEVRPFVMIRNSEAQHIAAWEFLFARYEITLPARPTTVDLPELTTLADACNVGVTAETANFGLYDDILTTVADYPDMVQIATSLQTASEDHHLPAFEQCAAQ